MKYKISAIAVAATLLVSCGEADKQDEVALGSGVETEWLSEDIRPQDNYDQYVNQKFYDTQTIPDDMVAWGGFMTLFFDTEDQVQTIIDTIKTPTGADGERGQLENLYASFMNDEAREGAGVSPVMPMIEKIAAVPSKKDLMMLTTELRKNGYSSFFSLGVGQDAKDATRYIISSGQAGTGLGDKSDYFDDSEDKVKMREAYRTYVASLLDLLGMEDPAGKAQTIYDLEYKFAEVQWDLADRRDSEKTYNKYTISELDETFPMPFTWREYVDAAGGASEQEITLRHPSFYEGAGKVIAEADLETLKLYLQYRVIRSDATALNQAAFDVNFEYFGKTLNGQKAPSSKDKRAMRAVSGNLGEALGKLYVEKYFPERAKVKMETLVNNLIDTFGDEIENLEWMTEETKKKAQAKRLKFNYKIGYPDVWKDRSAVTIEADDYYGNLGRLTTWAYEDSWSRLGGPIDRTVWGMTPQTVNAYYSRTLNEIVFPAAILQPPFFNMDADDAVNYGAIGAVIGHEIGHAFDDQGRKSDGDGNIADWWTEEDAKAFDAKANAIKAQYAEFEILPDLFINSEQTIGEDIGDFTGLSIGWKAYKKSLGGKEAPVIDGLTGDERFFLGWAQIWRSMQRENYKRRLQVVDTHSPDKARILLPLKNFQPFYDTYGVKEGDGMWIPPEKRVRIW